MSRSKHQQRVDEFMRRAGQEVPDHIKIPSKEVRILRAKLIMEETLETIEAMGVSAQVVIGSQEVSTITSVEDIKFTAQDTVCLEKVADGCADLKVVTTGTLSAFGIDDSELQREVDGANLRKFGPGSYMREDGKWIKPEDWEPPNVARAIGLEKDADAPNYIFTQDDYVRKICPHCSNPISDEVVRRLASRTWSESRCPQCMEAFILELTEDYGITLEKKPADVKT